MAKPKQEYTCTVEFTEGWEKRVTDAFVELYYRRVEQGKEMLLPNKKSKEESGASA